MKIIDFDDRSFLRGPETETATCHVCHEPYEAYADMLKYKLPIGADGKHRDRLLTCSQCETKKPCAPQSHKWEISIECGTVVLEATDPCSWEHISLMNGPSACREDGYDFEDALMMGPLPCAIELESHRDWQTGVIDDWSFNVVLNPEEPDEKVEP